MLNLKAIYGLVSTGKNVFHYKNFTLFRDLIIIYFLHYFSAESFVGKALVVKGIRKHAKMRMGIIHYRYCHYFVRLVEGLPPKHYYTHKIELTGNEKLEEYFNELRSRRIQRTL